MSRMARVKREALLLVGDPATFVGDRAALEISFARALSGLWMAYQPIVSWPDGRIHGYEALLRTNEQALGNPTVFLSGAERLGRLRELGRGVREAIATNMQLAPGETLFVNLHPSDLADEQLYSRADPLAPFASSIVLEITERASLDTVGDLQSRLAGLRSAGFRIALDDLGAGYAGLTSLAQLQPEVVKLDMSLVRDVDTNLTKQKLVGTMARLSMELDMRVVVEGVETVGERDALATLGCDLFQGHLFGRPVRRAGEAPRGVRDL
jgi:EAL domain-containing protein (putative c-di-GMP-specific phosphodiesterase class I)